ncbi:MAG: GNAT family N-acetyltransferase [Theionarchaea archaeon]|nr:GNAT family N-acetyltransferase [Theionarchaea archaeon]
MEMRTTDTIQDIGEKEWNALADTDYIDQTYAWYRTVEDSRIRNVHYVFVKEGKTLISAACCYPYRERMYLEMPFLEVRSPLGTSRSFFSKTPEGIRVLIQGLEEIQKKEKTQGFLILDLRKDEIDPITNHMKGFTSFPMMENTYMDLDYTDFDDYLSTLSRKARGNIRNTLNKAQKRWNIKTVFTNDFSGWGHTAHQLQDYICKKHDDYRWYLTEEFYSALETQLKERAELLLFLKDDIPLASGLCLNSPNICECKAAGINPDYREYQAYFLMYYEEIRRAIERRQKRIYFGSTTYEFKEKIGSKRENLFGFFKLRNPLLNFGLKSFITISRLWGKKL